MTRVETLRTIKLVVTPDMAKQWLSPLSITPNSPFVKRLAQRIQLNEWDSNGSSITFDQDGYLADGLHRLHAIIEADKPVLTHVTMPMSMLIPKTWLITPLPNEGEDPNE